MRLTRSLITTLLLGATVAAAQAAAPLEMELEPQFFTFSEWPGTFRTSIRWGEINVLGHDGNEVFIKARIVPTASTPVLEGLVDLLVEEDTNVMNLAVDSRVEGFYGVELDIRLPRETRVELEMTDGGEISVVGVKGEVDVVNRNGSVDLSQLGSAAVVDARNGSITASFERVHPDLPMSFSTLNGSLDVTLPPDVAATARIRHTYGGVESDFPLTSASGEAVAADLDDMKKGETRVLSASINGGGPRYDFYTANGTVYLRQGRQAQ